MNYFKLAFAREKSGFVVFVDICFCVIIKNLYYKTKQKNIGGSTKLSPILLADFCLLSRLFFLDRNRNTYKGFLACGAHMKPLSLKDYSTQTSYLKTPKQIMFNVNVEKHSPPPPPPPGALYIKFKNIVVKTYLTYKLAKLTVFCFASLKHLRKNAFT